MKNMIRIRNSVIIILCITVVSLAVGFIVLSVELKKKSDEVPSLDVSFVDISKTNSVKGSDIEPDSKSEIISNGKEIEINYTMNSTHDEVTYVATIENKGNLPAEIVDIIESPDYKKDEFKKLIYPITINLSDINGKIIPPGEKVDLKIIAYYNSNNGVSPTSKSFSYKLGIIARSR